MMRWDVHSKMCSWMRLGLLGLVALTWLVGCTKPEHRAARDYRNKLADEIAKSSFIEVIEHSYIDDFPEESFPEFMPRSFDDVPTIEYARIRLSAEQKEALVKRVRSFDRTASPVVSFCSFDPHHTIEFHSDAGIISRFEICFGCSGFSWDAARLQGSPESWMQEFKGFIAEIGMRPEADWKDLVLKSGQVPIRR
ncbi:hypothetical protein OKA04_19285 [Luteolibacter flavescens]|uniref:Lipoprotein n=1 Tax=Luteolibacter flavescens TaxID=1859460 RepID=A0ABT3FTM9_9BACT|nr:hypothetical protein [Luteolibacter flavescens]MCW1886892.1 hypothetical protein [Luteolibacter flavescens]